MSGQELAPRLCARLTLRGKELRARLGHLSESVFVHPLGDRVELGEVRATPHLKWYTTGANRKHPRPWPPTLPLPLTFGQALDAIERGAESMTAQLAAKIEATAHLVVRPEQHVDAVLAREYVSARWPWPDRHEADTPHPAWIALHYLEEAEALDGRAARGDEDRTRLENKRQAPSWPPEVAALDAALWARDALNAVKPHLGDMLEELVRHDEAPRCLHLVTPDSLKSEELDADNLHLPTYGLGLLYHAAQAVERDRRRPEISLDANREHHHLLMGWRDLPKHPRHRATLKQFEGRLELIAPRTRPGQRSIQLHFDLGDENTPPSEALVRGLRTLVGPEGLRHWAALQRLWSVEGGRQGWVRWTLDAHLEALGIPHRERMREEQRKKAARMVELMTELQLAVYDERGVYRERSALILVGRRMEQLAGSKWRLEGMDLELNELLYGGVRNAKTGELGRNFHPAPVELAQVNHAQHPYTLTLGLLLPIRWHMALGDGRDHVSLSGRKLLEMAGGQDLLKRHARDPKRAWGAVERDLQKLQRIGGLGSWEWRDGEHTLAGLVRLEPPAWMLDRTFRGVAPVELPPGTPALTGQELREWRKAKGHSQAKAAEVLAVGVATLKRAEASPEKALGRALRDALRGAR